jgi:hypothetical protein
MKTKTLSTLSKGQQELEKLITEALQSGTGPLADMFGKFNAEGFNQGVAKPAIENFKNEILPQLHEQYIGSNRGLSTARGAAATKAGADLQSKLAALLYQAQEQQKQNRIGGANTLFGKQAVENVVQQPAAGGGGLSQILGPLASVAGGFLGGPGGAAAANAIFGGGAKMAPTVG